MVFVSSKGSPRFACKSEMRVVGKSRVDLNSKDERGIPAQEVEESWRLIIQFQDSHYLRPLARFQTFQILPRFLHDFPCFQLSFFFFSFRIRVDEFYESFPPFLTAWIFEQMGNLMGNFFFEKSHETCIFSPFRFHKAKRNEIQTLKIRSSSL